MSSLSVYHVSSPELPYKVLTHLEDIASTLAEHGVVFDRWLPGVPLAAGASREELISAYRVQIDRLMTERGYTSVDVANSDSSQADAAEQRATLLDEHLYEEDDVRFVVSGRALFSLHIGDFVYAVLCERNDLLCIPAGIRRWFDAGEHPRWVAIHLFSGAQRPQAKFTGEAIASQFPLLED